MDLSLSVPSLRPQLDKWCEAALPPGECSSLEAESEIHLGLSSSLLPCTAYRGEKGRKWAAESIEKGEADLFGEGFSAWLDH